MEKYVVHIGIFGSRTRGNNDVRQTYGFNASELKTVLHKAGLSVHGGYLNKDEDAHIAAHFGPELVRAFCGEVKGQNPATVHSEIVSGLYDLCNSKGKKQAVFGDITIKTEWFELAPALTFKSPN